MFMQVIYQAAAKSKSNFYTVSLLQLSKRSTQTFVHYHDILELGVCLEGCGQCLTDTAPIEYQKGDTQCILPWQPHYNISFDDATLWMFINIDLSRLSTANITFSPSFTNSLLQKIKAGGVYKSQSKVSDTIKEIAFLLQSENQDPDFLALKILLLLTTLGAESDGGQTAAKDKNILPALHFVSSYIKKGLRPTPKSMADACFMSESYFRKIFTTYMGESPKNYITRMQMQQAAAKLMTETSPITQIAEQCGFRDFSTFYRDFKSIYGVSPRAYRENGGPNTPKKIS